MADLHWTEVDGVPTVWAETRGPLLALLQFRTGFADETLVTRGRTHLVEHLVLSTIQEPGLNQNGFVSATATGFHCSGRPEEVVGFLSAVCGAIESLPLDRLSGEKRVLSAEAARRVPSMVERLLTVRFGPTGFGLASLDEEGIESATERDLLALVAERFTRGNAVLCLSGPPPRGLRLPLRPGPRHPVPEPAPVLASLPAWDLDPQGTVAAASAVVPRVDAAPLLVWLAAERLRERLRTSLAVSYAPQVAYDPLGPEAAHLALLSDSDHEHRPDLVRGFLDVVEGLSAVGEAELDPGRAAMIRSLEDQRAMRPDELAVEAIQRAAQDWLLGRKHEPMDATLRTCAAVPAGDVARLGRRVLLDALVVLPGEAEPRPWLGQRARSRAVPPVAGAEVRHLDHPVNPSRLVHGKEGVTVLENCASWTVRFDALAAAHHRADGGLVLTGLDGTTLTLEPTLWRDGERVCGEIRRGVPHGLLLRRPGRDPSLLPRPVTNRLQRTLAWFEAPAPPWQRIARFALGTALFGAVIATLALGGEWFLVRYLGRSGSAGAVPFLLVGAAWLYARSRRRAP